MGSEVKTPLDMYLQRHSPLSPDLWLHDYSRLSARYTIIVPAGTCPEPVFPYMGPRGGFGPKATATGVHCVSRATGRKAVPANHVRLI